MANLEIVASVASRGIPTAAGVRLKEGKFLYKQTNKQTFKANFRRGKRCREEKNKRASLRNLNKTPKESLSNVSGLRSRLVCILKNQKGHFSILVRPMQLNPKLSGLTLTSSSSSNCDLVHLVEHAIVVVVVCQIRLECPLLVNCFCGLVCKFWRDIEAT